MASSASLLSTYRDAAIAALAAGDYPAAINNALAAQMVLSTLGDMDRNAGPAGGQRLAWDRHGVDSFILRVRQQQGAALGVQFADVQIADPQTIDQGEQFANTAGGYVQ